MDSVATISHKGVVKEITDNAIRVEIIAQSACVSCKAKSICGVDTQEKLIEIRNWNESYSIGENVMVLLREKLGLVALLYAYILPFILLLSVLLISLQMNVNEGLSALFSISVLIPYYIVLYLNRERLQKKFSFEIKKMKI
ncbi:MAG TPA: SoxR reducing system RseC family protein [Bacteroidales bacterium]|jgi:sigma-E factor negative regulatory protein RseC|nr:SoxR reducing system RseC family protein [Bacteroidales bacterium]MDD4235781.1 SoxR reducing system RseC family protein [Bacteroidales bacterium]MDY0160475.1 SoxR reducing system RseC family protein [Bacteroidales bacterium]HXK82208.1 SoxR reducing system RseC family protein [Bacteroidales bacterium]